MSKMKLYAGEEVVLFDTDQPLQKHRGKYSIVYRGHSLKTGEEVLVKRLRGITSLQDPSLKKYELLVRLRHPALQKVTGVGRGEKAVYVVMGYTEGTDLKQYLEKEGRFRDPRQAGQIIAGLLEGLEVYHQYRLIHTDIKPSNILLYEGRDGRPRGRLLDPGEALWLAQPLPAKKPFSLIYSPPEQVLGHIDLVGPASDIYSMGVVLWEMITGERPFRAAHPAAVMNLQLNQPLRKHRRIPAAVAEVIARAAAKKSFPRPPAWYPPGEVRSMLVEGIAARYPSATEFLRALQGALR